MRAEGGICRVVAGEYENEAIIPPSALIPLPSSCLSLRVFNAGNENRNKFVCFIAERF